MASIDIGSLFHVNGLVAVITGGGTGIGLLMAKALAVNGALKVYIIGRRKDKLEAAAKESPHGNIVPLPGDVSSKESLEQAAAHVKSEIGYINLLVANSGVSGPSPPNLPTGHSVADLQEHMMSVPMEDFTQALHVNTTGVFYTAFAFLELLDAGNKKGNMPETVRSQIIATSSIAAFNRAVGAGFAYNASKVATTHLVKMLATFLVPYKIRCNALAPGLFPSEIAAPLLKGKGATKEGAFESSFIPAEKTGDEQDMAGTILYLASRAGAYVNGNILIIDGGRLSILPATY